MRILSVIRIKAYSRYGYDYLSKIILRIVDFQEYTIAEKDFKNLYPSDFEDLNLLLLQGHLDHLPGSNKRMISTALNLTKPGWDATGYEFKHDYTIIKSPRAVVFQSFNSLVHSLRALSNLRRSILRTASAAAKPYQGDSSEFYLITGNPDSSSCLQETFRNSDACYHDLEKCEHAGPKITTLHGGNTTTRIGKRFTMPDDLKESSKITQVKGTKSKDHYIMYKEINA
ncbi:hypothetical protein Tco_1121946 [Tanacetum coccineum]|uniref:Uncharacterized protein n=1 Tax=Tanacetum coccineum TaxID=301880 RepID=A0ABQ5IZ58_9ASTR